MFKWIPIGKISYASIASSTGLASSYLNELVKRQFLINETSIKTYEEIVNMMQLGQLKQLATKYYLTSKKLTKRTDYIQALLKHFNEQKGLNFTNRNSTTSDSISKINEALRTKYLNDCKMVLGRSYKLNKSTRDLFLRLFMLYFVSTSHKCAQLNEYQSYM